MALIDELKQRRETATRTLAQIEQRIADEKNSVARVTEGIADLDRAITALEAPAQPLDELRSVPGAEEEVRDHLIDAQTSEEVDPRVSWKAEPEIPEGFTKWEGGEDPVSAEDSEGYIGGPVVEVIYRDGVKTEGLSWTYIWSHENADHSQHIIAYRIIEAPASEQDASEAINDLVDELVGDVTFSPDTVAMQTYMDGDQVVIREISAEEMYAPPPTDLWQQGYNDKLNGFKPSLAEPEYLKGYEARALIEREHNETMGRAKFFEGGMMADADRHQSDQRSIVEKIGGVLGFKQKVDA